MKYLKRLNDSLPYLVLGIILYGVVIQLTGVWFVKEKLLYSTGLWYGIAIAVAMAINLAKVVHDAYYFGPGSKKGIIARSLLRYVVVVILFMAIGYFKFGNLFTAIIGVFGLKAAAYLTPGLQKFVGKLTGKGEDEKAPEPDENENSKKMNVKEVTM